MNINRTEALKWLTVLTNPSSTVEEKHTAAMRLKELICLLLPDE